MVGIVFCFVVLHLASRLVEKIKPKFWLLTYLLVVFFSILPIWLYWLTSLSQSFWFTTTVALRLVFLLAITESIAAYLVAQIQARTAQLELHQEALVVSEEKLRMAIANHLHDNLQSHLVAVGIRMNMLKENLDVDRAQSMSALIAEIENIRQVDVRDFGRTLVPQIEVDGLAVSLHKLFAAYAPGISCSITGFDSQETPQSDSSNYNLGIYRIAEQAILNGIVHGKASNFEVSRISQGHSLEFQITNDGLPFHPESMQGHGLAVIDAWATKLGGTWELYNLDNFVILKVAVPRQISHM
jgi:hypothetical protein